MNTKQESNPTIDERFINETLSNLIEGFKCDEGGARQAKKILYPKNLTYVSNGENINAKNLKTSLVFEGDILRGGIYDEKGEEYISDNRRFSYNLEGDLLKINSICSKQGFTLQNFDAASNTLGIKLSKNPKKEIGICICANDSMREYVLAFKEVAPFLAKHIFGNEEDYVKITLIAFSYINTDNLGTFYESDGFTQAVDSIKTRDSNTRMLFLSAIRAMKNFTKDNRLKKEVYLISDDKDSDSHYADDMVKMTQNLNKNIVKNSGGCEDNCVKIHCFSVKNRVDLLKELADTTGGNFYHSSGAYDFKKNILTQASGGHFDEREIGNEIRPSKSHKIYDPDDPEHHKKP